MLDILKTFIDFIFHLDKYMGLLISTYGTFTYVILFMVIFLETGFVITPFLPGDSLLFVIGTFAAQDYLNIYILLPLLCIAAIIGDSVNYAIGKYFGEKISRWKMVKKEYLDKTREFYDKHGGKTIIFARFIPIVRTFAPFIAGIGKMNYKEFLAYNIIGGVVWVTCFLLAGYFFGNITWVKENLTLVIFIIILTSFIPAIHEFIKHHRRKRK